MKMYLKFSTFILYILFVCILMGCSRAELDQLTPTIQRIQPTENQITLTCDEHLVDFQTRPKDDMRMVFIPNNSFQMGSTEAEIEAAIDLCQQHYHICNRWYYERESPLHSVSLDRFWID